MATETGTQYDVLPVSRLGVSVYPSVSLSITGMMPDF